MTAAERKTELDRLQAKLDASRGQPGYGDRVRAIEDAIAALPDAT